MYQFSFKDEDSKNAIEKTTTSQSLSDKFLEIDKDFGNLTTAKELKLDEIEYEKPTEEKVKQKAEDSLYDYKNSTINKINDDYDSQNEQIDENISNLNDSKASQIETIENAYSAAKENRSNDLLKRGLARSSIAVNKLSELDSQMLDNITKVSSQTASKIEELGAKKSLLEQQKQSALNSFDIEYAIKLQDKIDNLNKDIYEKEQSVIKYNNQIKELKAKFDAEQNDSAFSKTKTLAELYGKYGTAVIDEVKKGQKYSVAKDYFSSMPKEDAIAELENNSTYKTQLGSYYTKLLNELKG